MKYIQGVLIIISILIPSLWSHDIFNTKRLSFVEFGASLGYNVNEYDVVTQDGYILKLFRIPGDKRRPVLLMHGIIDSADTFILRGNTSLSIVLAKSGYDVWIGNNRGNRYSRRHVYLDPDVDKEFWDFSFHESGFYDLPAMIDFILETTEAKSLSAIGHSQGNSIFLVLGATRPEYNEKINVMVSLAPICFLNNLKNVVYLIMKNTPLLAHVLRSVGQEEFLGDNTLIARIFRAVCGSKNNYILCVYGIFFPIAGNDPGEIDPEFYLTAVSHYPTGTSVKNGLHLSQVGLKGSFAHYDYESLNINIYNSSKPPDYDLNRVTMKVALVAGRNDELSKLKDIDLLRKKLPNVVEYVIIKHKTFNHLDAVWGQNMPVYLFPTVLGILSKFG